MPHKRTLAVHWRALLMSGPTFFALCAAICAALGKPSTDAGGTQIVFDYDPAARSDDENGRMTTLRASYARVRAREMQRASAAVRARG